MYVALLSLGQVGKPDAVVPKRVDPVFDELARLPLTLIPRVTGLKRIPSLVTLIDTPPLDSSEWLLEAV